MRPCRSLQEQTLCCHWIIGSFADLVSSLSLSLPSWVDAEGTVPCQREDGVRWQLQLTVSEYLQCEGSTKSFEYPLRTEDRDCFKRFSTIPLSFFRKLILLIPTPGEIMSLDQVWFLERESWVKTDLHIYAVLMAGFLTYSCISNSNSSFENKGLLNVLIVNRKFKQLPS